PFFRNPLARPSPLKVVPRLPGLAFQCVHSADVADAYARTLVTDVRGPFNVAAEPVLDADRLARVLGAYPISLPDPLVRGVVSPSWRLHLQPTPPGWLDLALGVPLMECGRAERELGWRATRSSEEALLDLIDGLREGEGAPTPPLEPEAGGVTRAR